MQSYISSRFSNGSSRRNPGLLSNHYTGFMTFKNKLHPFGLMLLIILFGSSIGDSISTAASKSIASLDNSFEGKISLSRYIVLSDGREEHVSKTPLLVHPDFILLENAESGGIELIGNITAESILVRQRRQDFVFFTAERQAVMMNKLELQQMINMLESMRNASSSEIIEPPVPVMKGTSERATIDGMETQKWIISTDGSETEWHIWVTEEISIPWGMLSESWLTEYTFLSGLPTNDILDNNKLPVRAELWNDGKLVEILKFEDISPQSLNQSYFRIPDDYQRVNFQQMLFNRMRNR